MAANRDWRITYLPSLFCHTAPRLCPSPIHWPRARRARAASFAAARFPSRAASPNPPNNGQRRSLLIDLSRNRAPGPAPCHRWLERGRIASSGFTMASLLVSTRCLSPRVAHDSAAALWQRRCETTLSDAVSQKKENVQTRSQRRRALWIAPHPCQRCFLRRAR